MTAADLCVNSTLTQAWPQRSGGGKRKWMSMRCCHLGVHQVGVGAVVCAVLKVWWDGVRKLRCEVGPKEQRAR